jgi:hypothetical protein
MSTQAQPPETRNDEILTSMGVFLWLALPMSLLVVIFVLVPFFMTGGNVPSMEPGWVPDKPYEFASIAAYKGTLWENNNVLQEIFWRVGCTGWCVWLPVLILTLVEAVIQWPRLSQPARGSRKVLLGAIVVFSILWFIAGVRMLYLTAD